jgi:hypothetical protein
MFTEAWEWTPEALEVAREELRRREVPLPPEPPQSKRKSDRKREGGLGCVGLLLFVVTMFSEGTNSRWLFWNYASFHDMLYGTLGGVILMACLFALSRYGLRRLYTSFNLAMLAVPSAALFLGLSSSLNDSAAEEYAKHYVGLGFEPGYAYSAFAAASVVGAMVALSLGLRAALGSGRE